MVEPMDPSSQRRIVRWGGAAAVAGGVYSLVIATIYVVTRVGAAGDRLFGSLVAIGQFGYAWLGFTRSGNYSIGPGILCVELGLLVFVVDAARGHTVPRRIWVLPFLMAVLPIIVIAASQIMALLRGTRLLYIDDIYFQGLYVARAVLWIVLGVLLWFEGNALTRSSG
jgi:ABC-type Fe3+ transport system permease subunit